MTQRPERFDLRVVFNQGDGTFETFAGGVGEDCEVCVCGGEGGEEGLKDEKEGSLVCGFSLRWFD